jgi:hypothetical protein
MMIVRVKSHFDTSSSFDFSFIVSDTWMCLKLGEGEKEIANHGWSRVESFSQETEAIGQRTSRSDEHEPKLHTQSQVQDAHDSPTQLPFSLSSQRGQSAAAGSRGTEATLFNFKVGLMYV